MPELACLPSATHAFATPRHHVGKQELAAVLPDCGWLTELRLTGNCVADAGATALAKAMRGAPSLRRLRLSSNCIGDAGGSALATALAPAPLANGSGGGGGGGGGSVLCPLRRLELAHNRIGSSAAAELCRVLPATTQLTYLDVEANRCVAMPHRGHWA